MKIMFFPSDAGGGFGHLSRCLAIAHEANKRGHICRFLLNDRKYEKRVVDFFPVDLSCRRLSLSKFVDKWMRVLNKKKTTLPLFTEISGLNYQVIRDGFFDGGIVREKIKKYLKPIRVFGPDLLVGDTNLLAWMVSRHVDLPLVQIVRYASHPETAKLIWWKNKGAPIIPPDASAVFNPLLKRQGLETIDRAEDLLNGDLYLVPSIPEIEPVPENGKTFFTGELTLTGDDSRVPPWLNEIDEKYPLIYITIGGGAGLVGSTLFFKSIIGAFANKSLKLIVSTSGNFNRSDLPCPPENILFHKWVPGRHVISRSDLVVFHGGYGTMMETLSNGKPMVVIPFHTEQEGNGRRLEKLGCARVVRLSRQACQIVNGRWKHGEYSYGIQNRYELRDEELYRHVSQVLQDGIYLNSARKLRAKIRDYGGAEKAMEIIESRFS